MNLKVVLEECTYASERLVTIMEKISALLPYMPPYLSILHRKTNMFSCKSVQIAHMPPSKERLEPRKIELCVIFLKITLGESGVKSYQFGSLPTPRILLLGIELVE